MAMVDCVLDKTGEVVQLDNELNYFMHEMWAAKGNPVSEKEMEALNRESKWLLQKYGYNTEAVQDVLDEWAQNKGWLINLLKQHPNYVDGKFYIAFESEIERKISKSGIKKFATWVDNHVYECGIVKEQLAPMTREEYENLVREGDRLHIVLNKMDELNSFIREYKDSFSDLKTETEDGIEVTINDKGRDYYEQSYNQVKNKIYKYVQRGDKYYYREVETILDYITYTMNLLARVKDQFVDSELETKFNQYAEILNLKTEAKVGQKISKLYSKFFIEIGLSDYKEIRDYTFHDQNGIEHTKQKDYGYNYYFYSVFADSVNPVKFKRHIVISVNPIDYWTQSFGNSWASCMTIDVNKSRQKQGGMDYNYGGMYSSGTESYMLDGSTVVLYYVDSNCKSDFELEDKYKRCLFYIGENKMIQSRVYPDGRDGTDIDEDSTSAQIAKDIRATMEAVIAECLGVPDSWVYKGGTATASSMAISTGSHYRDYENYNDCGTVFLKIGDRLVKNANKIPIGHVTICPSCGKTHSESSNIQCEGCITRDYKTNKQINFIKAFKWNGYTYETQKDRDDRVRAQAGEGDVQDVIDSLHEQDFEYTEYDVPSTPFLDPEIENGNQIPVTEGEAASNEASDETVA